MGDKTATSMNRNRIILLILILCLMRSQISWGAWINDSAPNFTAQNIHGKSVSMENMKGKVILIDFWASWCAPCKKEFPELQKLAERYKDSDIVILAINIDKKRENADAFLVKQIPIPQKMMILLDPESKVVSSYGARAMPTSFIIDKSGIIKYVHLGFREKDPNQWITEIETLLK